MSAKQILQSLKQVSRSEKAAFFRSFMQSYPGGYGEGDRFLGCVVPDMRKIAMQFRDLKASELPKLWTSPWHECRLTGMFILVDQFERAYRKTNSNRECMGREIVDLYLANLSAVNNWDIVDSTAPKILGRWLLEHPSERVLIDQLSKSTVIWERRVAVLSTMPLIRAHQFGEILQLATDLLGDDHDLMHKAIGWMLREVGKRNPEALDAFLHRHAGEMPRTMLRYSIEKLPPSKRTIWMKKKTSGLGAAE